MRGEVGLVAHAQPQIPVVSESPGEGGGGGGGGEGGSDNNASYQHWTVRVRRLKYQH